MLFLFCCVCDKITVEGGDKMPKKIGKPKETEEKENELVKQLREDEKLRSDPDFRMGMIAMAEMFVENFADNMYKTSIELHSLPSPYCYYSIDSWKDFLNYPIVRKYIKSFRDEQINMIADQGLAEGDKGAVSIKKAIQESSPGMNNSNIVLIRLPEKKEFDVE